jgi:hypothetical protein
MVAANDASNGGDICSSRYLFILPGTEDQEGITDS